MTSMKCWWIQQCPRRKSWRSRSSQQSPKTRTNQHEWNEAKARWVVSQTLAANRLELQSEKLEHVGLIKKLRKDIVRTWSKLLSLSSLIRNQITSFEMSTDVRLQHKQNSNYLPLLLQLLYHWNWQHLTQQFIWFVFLHFQLTRTLD